jgi:cytidine deaminase
MVTDDELYRHAKERLNPRPLSEDSSAGGVASALVTDRGSIFTGVCIDTPCSMGFCAEHNAIGSMITEGESAIATIVAVRWDGTVVPPCGRCREFVYQVNPANLHTRVLLGQARVSTIEALLPERWTAG